MAINPNKVGPVPLNGGLYTRGSALLRPPGSLSDCNNVTLKADGVQQRYGIGRTDGTSVGLDTWHDTRPDGPILGTYFYTTQEPGDAISRTEHILIALQTASSAWELMAYYWSSSDGWHFHDDSTGILDTPSGNLSRNRDHYITFTEAINADANGDLLDFQLYLNISIMDPYTSIVNDFRS